MTNNYFTLICTEYPKKPVYAFFNDKSPISVAKAFHRLTSLVPQGHMAMYRIAVYRGLDSYKTVPVIGEGL